MGPTRIVIAPGIGAAADSAGNCFYASLCSKLRKRFPECEVVLRDYPDPYGAKEYVYFALHERGLLIEVCRSVWIPFMKEELRVDDNTIRRLSTLCVDR